MNYFKLTHRNLRSKLDEYFVPVLVLTVYLTIFPQLRVGFEVIDNQRGATIIIVLLNKQEILLDLADFDLHERSEDDLMAAVTRARYNG